MLFWEALKSREEEAAQESDSSIPSVPVARRTQRLPYDKRCAAITKSGRRCRGTVRPNSDFCVFHDPAITAETRRSNAAKGGRRRHRLAHLPDGYLRKLTSRAAIGEAMDRLYREVRLGILTPEMGRVLFDILTRVMETYFNEQEPETKKRSTKRHTKAERIKPKLSALLTQREREAWAEAVSRTPAKPAEPPRRENASAPDRNREPASPASRLRLAKAHTA